MTLPWVLLSCLVTSPHQETGQEIPRFGIEVRTVYVDVFVKQDGKPVTDLTAADFELLDNGVPQKVELLDHREMPLTTMLLLDVSDSVLGDKLNHHKAAAHAFVEALETKDEVGLLTFTREMRLRNELSSDFASLHRALEEPMEQGWTSLNDALYAGLKLVELRAGRPLIILLTDGLDTTSWLEESELFEVLKASEAVVYVVGAQPPHRAALRMSGRSLQHKADVLANDFLQAISAATGGRVWYLDPGANLEDIFLRILEEMKNRYLLFYQPRDITHAGWHDLEVKLKGRPDVKVRARPGYLVPEKPKKAEN
jgi:Ca-activated chloride channel family protein